MDQSFTVRNGVRELIKKSETLNMNDEREFWKKKVTFSRVEEATNPSKKRV